MICDITFKEVFWKWCSFELY